MKTYTSPTHWHTVGMYSARESLLCNPYGAGRIFSRLPKQMNILSPSQIIMLHCFPDIGDTPMCVYVYNIHVEGLTKGIVSESTAVFASSVLSVSDSHDVGSFPQNNTRKVIVCQHEFILRTTCGSKSPYLQNTTDKRAAVCRVRSEKSGASMTYGRPRS